ncbi:unnamed protein product [Choristocarpus tenellus]
MNSMEHDPWSYHDSYNSDSDGWDDNQWVCSNCNMRNHSMMPECEVCGLKKGEVAPIFSDIEESGHQWLFLEPGSQLLDHEKALMSDRDGYLATLDLLLRAGFSMSAANLARVVATLAAHQEHLHVNRFLPSLGVVEMLSVLKMLDAPRKMRQLKRKLDNLNEVKVSKKQTKQTKIQAQITSLEQEALSKGGVTGSLSKRVRRLLADIPAVKLEFYMLNFPRQPWQEIADLVHCSPDGFKVPYFLSFMMGKDPPADSIVARVFAANAEDVKGLLEDFPNLASCYSYLRSRFKGNLQDDVKLALVRTAPLEDVLWFYEELMCSGAEDEVDRRLARGDAIETAGRSRSSYAKLMERLLLFRKMHLKFAPRLLKYTEERLRLVKVSADSRVAVLGDASSSMGVAIETATIIASLLSVCLKADLCFFNGEVFDPPCIPSSAEEVLEVTRAVRASGCTSPAAALWRYYSTWQPVDLFVCVSDEDENTPHQVSQQRSMPLDFVCPTSLCSKTLTLCWMREMGRGQGS